MVSTRTHRAAHEMTPLCKPSRNEYQRAGNPGTGFEGEEVYGVSNGDTGDGSFCSLVVTWRSKPNIWTRMTWRGVNQRRLRNELNDGTTDRNMPRDGVPSIDGGRVYCSQHYFADVSRTTSTQRVTLLMTSGAGEISSDTRIASVLEIRVHRISPTLCLLYGAIAKPTSLVPHPHMSLPPVFYHHFRTPLPYARTLALQERIYQIQLASRHTSSHHDVLLLLQHRPVYTAGRRQTEHELRMERSRLTKIGADFVIASRGGQLTYHGPGQLVGYPLLDLGRTSPPIGIREYICKMQRMIQSYLSSAHKLTHVPSEHTGVFLDPMTKVASIGVQVRHRLTTHGFAMNITQEPLEWFDKVVACGLADVKAGCIASAAGKQIQVHDVIEGVVDAFSQSYGRDMKRLELESVGELGKLILQLEEEAVEAGDWPSIPIS